jgi:hypothetical protein
MSNVPRRLLLMSVLTMSLTAGLCSHEIENPGSSYDGPGFCDLVDLRLFTREQIEWRSTNDRENLERDLSYNSMVEEFCSE